MTRDSKLLLAAFVVGMVALAGFQFWLHTRFFALNLKVAAEKAKATPVPTVVVSPTPEVTASSSASVRATATPRVRATATPVATATAEPAE
jgi:hypothetical protein